MSQGDPGDLAGLIEGDATISTSNEWQNMEQAAAGDPTNTISYLPWLKQQITIDGQPFGFCRQPLGLATIDRFGTGSIPPHLAHEGRRTKQMKIDAPIDPQLKHYIESSIIPQYNQLDSSHSQRTSTK